MKTVLLTLSLAFCSCLSARSQELKLTENNIDEVLKAMTLEEKATLIVGETNGYWSQEPIIGKTESLIPGVAGTTQGIKRLGITQMALADGPAGLRVSTHRKNDSKTYYTTGIPVGTNLACSWNTELLESVGKIIGNEVHEYGVDVILSPAVNIMRSPLCGRNFEYYSEDPFLTGKIAAAFINGVQSNGVGTSIKHFAANNQETNRNNNDAIVSQRALREIYLKGFEIAIKESRPWTVMASYNRINGPYTQESRELLTTILRDEWGFEGLVMTDWIGQRNTAAQVHAGNDLMEPGSQKQTDEIIARVKSGELSETEVDVCVRRMLELIVKTPHFKNYVYSNTPDLKAHAQLARKAASEGIVLLKNYNETLPLPLTKKNIALFGVTSYKYIAGGTGSGDMDRAYVVGLTDGLINAGFDISKKTSDLYNSYFEFRKAQEQNGRAPELAVSRDFINRRAEDSDVAVITIGRNGGEGSDRRIEDNFNLASEELDLIDNVTEAFHIKGKQVIVILNVFGVVETASWKGLPDAILCAWQGGQEGGNAVADILAGKENPSGKLSMTFPISCYDHPSTLNFPLSNNNSRGRSNRDEVQNVDYTLYNEGIYVGYRYFTSAQKEVSYPFGFGLSYTQFAYSNAKLKSTKDGFIVSVSIKNIGDKAGKEIVQLYATAPSGSLNKPAMELKSFAKTKMLQPGEIQIVSLEVKNYDLASYDESSQAWVTDKGTYTLHIGASVSDIRQEISYTLAKSESVKCNDVLKPTRKLDELKIGK